MPREKSRLTRTEEREYRCRLSDLRGLGLAVGRDSGVSNTAPQLRLEQIDVESARIFSFVSGGFVFVAPLRLTVLASQLFLAGFEMTAFWDSLPLELEEPRHFPLYEKILGDYPPEPDILNSWLIGERGLSRHRRNGLLIAMGQTPPPSQFRDGAILGLGLSLWDESGAELHYEFRGSVDHSVYQRALEGLRKNRKPRMRIFPEKSQRDFGHLILTDATRKNKV